MSNLDELLARLNPKVAKSFQTARETHNEMLPTASHGLTDELNGGFGKGRIAMVYGNTSAGKSALMMQSMGMWQKMAQTCAYVDVEGTWDNGWATHLGVDVDDMLLVRDRSVSKIYNKIRPLLEEGLDAIVIDSMSMILSDAFIDGDGRGKDLENQVQIGAQAKAIARLCNAIHYSNENTAVVLISQTTTEMGQTYTKQVPTGGKKPMFASSQIVKLTSSNTDAKQIKGSVQVGNKMLEYPIGRKVDALVEKNKLGPQGGAVKYDFYYRGDYVGVDHVGEVVDEAVKFGVIDKGGAWYSYGDDRFQGRDAIVTHFRSCPDDLDAAKKELEEFKNGSVRQEV